MFVSNSRVISLSRTDKISIRTKYLPVNLCKGTSNTFYTMLIFFLFFFRSIGLTSCLTVTTGTDTMLANIFYNACRVKFLASLYRVVSQVSVVLNSCIFRWTTLNPLNPELNPICYLLALLGANHFLYVSRIRVKLLTFRRLMSYIYAAPILDVSRSHTTTQHSR